MASYRAEYTLYQRKRKSGKPVYYYRTYTLSGRRTCAHSTGCTRKRDAREYCRALLRGSETVRGKPPLFSSYAEGFFDEGKRWHQDKLLCARTVTVGYVKKLQQTLSRHILPHFKDIPLTKLVPSSVIDFRLSLGRKNLSAHTINNICDTLKIISDTLENDCLIAGSPFRGVKRIADSGKKRDAFTLDELKQIFSHDWKQQNCRDAVLVASCTGLRIGEIMAIREESLGAYCLEVDVQRQRGLLVPTKTKQKRLCPLTPALRAIIERNIASSPGPFAFPFSGSVYLSHLYRAYTPAMEAEKKRRFLSFHSLRHFFNTFLLSQNVAPHKVAAVMGHAASAEASGMQERYTSWRIDHFPEVYRAQENLLHILDDPAGVRKPAPKRGGICNEETCFSVTR